MSNWENDIIEYTDGLLEQQGRHWRRSIEEGEFRISYKTTSKEVVVTIPRQVAGYVTGEAGDDIAACSEVEVVKWEGRKVGEGCSLLFSIGSDFGIGYDEIDLGYRITRVLEILHDTLDGAMPLPVVKGPVVEDYETTNARLRAAWERRCSED